MSLYILCILCTLLRASLLDKYLATTCMLVLFQNYPNILIDISILIYISFDNTK